MYESKLWNNLAFVIFYELRSNDNRISFLAYFSSQYLIQYLREHH
jgi:hypothetical protein